MAERQSDISVKDLMKHSLGTTLKKFGADLSFLKNQSHVIFSAWLQFKGNEAEIKNDPFKKSLLNNLLSLRKVTFSAALEIF